MPTISLPSVKQLLATTNFLVAREKAEEKIKGEKFNLFSILKMETKENDTHSAFLGELLNPQGDHLMGSRYLKLFLAQIEDETLDPHSTKVILEKYIGPKRILKGAQAKNSTGGRIDIYLKDAKGNILSIENKINAPEQELQVLRYYNYKTERNTVYYLTLNGESPSPYSTCKLKSGYDFQEISYAHDILIWLKACQKESTDQPILRETIKQYYLLIKKITGQMSDDHTKALHHQILSNFEAAHAIAANLKDARKVLCEEIRQAVFKGLQAASVAPELEVILGNDVEHRSSQIFIRRRGQTDVLLVVTLESFSGEGNFNGDLALGILDPPPHNSGFAAVDGNTRKLGGWVINHKKIEDYDGLQANLSNEATIQALYTDAVFKSKFIAHLVKEMLQYVVEQYPTILEFLATNESRLSQYRKTLKK
ncbi:MAG: PD-(D/E)XK nuclease family protein [Saprospiraceae bacterium]